MPPTSDLEAGVLAAIDDEQILRDLTDLVAIPSVDGTPAEAAAQRWCAERLEEIGLDVDLWEIDLREETSQPDFPGMEVERTEALGCVGVLGDPTSTPALALCGHTDVVPPGDLGLWPDRDPFTLRVDDDARAWGRGTCDMKAGLIAAIAAARALQRSGVTLVRPLAVHCVSGEEDGGLGAYATLRRGHRADTCVIAEPTAGTIIPANAGSLTFRLDVTGLATHGSTRSRGVSAIEKFEVVHRSLRDLEASRNIDRPALFAHLDLPWPLSVGTVRAGDWASTVPDQLTATGRYGVRTGETLDEATAAFEDAVSTACEGDPWLRDHPVKVTWDGGRFAPGELPDGHGLADVTSTAVADVLGDVPERLGGPYGSDLRHYAGADVATLQYGPGDVRFAHAVDEHVPLDEVFACARIYALTVLRSCGVASADA
jgi:acetylornithine deacetylase